MSKKTEKEILYELLERKMKFQDEFLEDLSEKVRVIKAEYITTLPVLIGSLSYHLRSPESDEPKKILEQLKEFMDDTHKKLFEIDRQIFDILMRGALDPWQRELYELTKDDIEF